MRLVSLLWGFLFPVLLAIIYELSRPDVLLVGNVTIDLVDGTSPTGGAVSYAAVAIKVFGMSACVVTVAGPDADLTVFEGLDVHVVPTKSTLTFEHSYPWFGHQRRLRVTSNPNITLSRSMVPARCRRARTILLGPLTLFDIDAGSFLHHDSFWGGLLLGYQHIGLLGQGFQRQLVQGGKVAPLDAPSAQLLEGLGKRVSLFLSDVETDSWPPGAIESVASRTARLVVTRGSKGADEYNASGIHHIPTNPVDRVEDTNGAGDTFATAYLLGLAQALPNPASQASWAASRAVMMPQRCKPHCACDKVKGKGVKRWGPLSRLQASAAARGHQLKEAVGWAQAAAAKVAVAWQQSVSKSGFRGGVVAGLLGAAASLKTLLHELVTNSLGIEAAAD